MPSRVERQFDEVIASFLPEGDWIPGEVAAKAVRHLWETNPDLLTSWLDEHSEAIICRYLTSLLSAQRSAARRRAKARGFAAEVAAAGGPQAYLDTRHRVDHLGTQRCLRDMNGADLEFVAGHYDRTSNSLKLLQAFYRAMARRVGDHTVGEVLTEQEIADLYDRTRKDPDPDT